MRRACRYRLRPGTRPAAQRGFTLVELLVVIAIIGILAIILWPSLHKMMLRNRLLGQATEVTIAMRQARLEAIKRNSQAVVRADFANDQMLVFVDVDGDGSFTPDTSVPRGTVDFELRRDPLPERVFFEGPVGGVEGADAVTGFSPNPDDAGAPNQAVFNPDGSIDDAGGFRFSDPRRNLLEVRVAPEATARIELRKFDGTNYVAQREGGKPWKWEM